VDEKDISLANDPGGQAAGGNQVTEQRDLRQPDPA
jgi:hypothetical protein